jgi:hypothetical protein
MKKSCQLLIALVLAMTASSMRIGEKMKHKNHAKIRSKKASGELKSEFF